MENSVVIINFIRFSTIFLILTFTFKNSYSENSLNREEIEEIIHEYIMQNPELILKSVEKLRQTVEKNEEDKKNYIINNFKTIANEEGIPWQGSADAQVILVEFFDYNCGYCKQSMDAITRIINENKNVKISFRDYPILSPISRIAAQAALAAQKQGKYFVFHRNLMNYESNLSEKIIFKIAEDSGLDIEELKKQINNPEITATIQSTESVAKNIGIRGTPTFIINGKLHAGALDYNRLSFLIEEALSEI